MPDSLPNDDGRGERRTARIEELLLSGLDYYFAGEHDRAINIWTRVLFLDRGHARARAYIERARGALAERQRESEELIDRGMSAFDQGDTSQARELLSSAIARGGPHDVAFALLDRLNRLDTAPAAGEARREPIGERPSHHVARARGSSVFFSRVLVALSVVAFGLAALYVAISVSGLGLLGPWQPTGPAMTSSRPAQDPLPLPRLADLALTRATALKDAGHLKDALVALDRINPADTAYGDAQRLRAEIQTLLLAGLPGPAARRDGR